MMLTQRITSWYWELPRCWETRFESQGHHREQRLRVIRVAYGNLLGTPEVQGNVVWVPPAKVMPGKWGVLVPSANGAYEESGPFPGPGSEAVSKEYLMFAPMCSNYHKKSLANA